MSVIIRLQNLPLSANAADVRHFFNGLAIPEGGVHIVGGELGDAFIAFSTDEDARRAMSLDGSHLKDSRVKLFLSSRSEMQATIEEARQRHLAYQAGFAAHARPVNGGGGGAPYPTMTQPQRPYAPETYPPVVPPQSYNNPYHQPPYEAAKSPPVGYQPYRPSSRGSDSDRSRDGGRGRYRRPERRRSRSRSRSRERRRRSRSSERYRPRPEETKFIAHREDGACVQLRCLGSELTYRVIRDFFDGAFLPNHNMKIVNALDGRRFGLAYVRFDSKADQQNALSKNNVTMRGQTFHVSPCDDNVFDDVIDSYTPGIPLNPKHFPNSCLCFRDFPPFATAQHVRDAVGSIAIYRVVPERNASGTYTGLCFIELVSETDARKAIQLLRDGVMIAGRPVTATLLPLAELRTAVERIEKLGIVPQRIMPPPQRPTRVVLSGLPPGVMERDVADFFSDVGVMPQAIEMEPGLARCQFASAQEAERALGKDGGFMGGSTVSVRLEDAPAMQRDSDARSDGAYRPPPPPQFAEPRFRGPRFDGFPAGGETRYRYPAPRGPAPRFEAAPPAGAPGCVVALTNVPPHAVIADIVDFFRGFRVDERSVLRRFGPNGEPTGDARVAFPTPDEADAALRARQNDYLIDRRVRLSIV